MNQETDIAKLDAAWDRVEKGISALGAIIRNDPMNNDPLHRYEGYKSVLALMAESYVTQVHYDRKRPECLPSVGSIFNYGGPATDFIYRMVHLEPGSTYRVWGCRGNAGIIDWQQIVGWFGQNKEKRSTVTVANELFDSQDLKLDAQGNFDFILSPRKQGEQWWKLDERANTLLIREYFIDYATQDRASTFHFDKLDNKGQASTIAGIDESSDRLDAYANALRDYSFVFTMHKIHAKDGDNKYMELNFGSDGGSSDQRYLQARFNIKPNEALIGKWTLPAEYSYWSLVLYGDAYQMLNFGNRQTSLNHAQAKAGSDGTFYFVLSHQDPGIANWLDLDGHEQGMVLIRTKAASAFNLPSLELVPIDQLAKHLPQDVARTNAEQRAQDLAVRRKHFQMREGR